MNKVLVTGLGTAKDLGICETCNLNFSWLLRNPSTLLWADQICVPEKAYEAAKNVNTRKDEKVICAFLEMAESHGLIDKIDLSSMYQESVGDDIYRKVLDISTALMEIFPDVVKKGDPKVPNEIIIEDERYCGSWMASICLNVKLANDIGANCLFGKREHTFLKYLYGVNFNQIINSGINNAYSEVFSLYLPENLGIHQYAFINEEQCKGCNKHKQCKEQYLDDTTNAIQKMLDWRDYDEIQQAKEEVNRIIKIKGQISTEKDIDDVIKAFKEKQDRINKNINLRFPQIKRWTKMTAVLATPITIASAITGNIPLTVGSAVAAGISQATEHLLEIYESKNNWVGFINRMKEN